MNDKPLIDLRALRQFVAVAEQLHFGRAAARLSMTQPPLTQAIQMLEQPLGVLLFERTRRSVRLSASGAALLDSARRLLADAAAPPSAGPGVVYRQVVHCKLRAQTSLVWIAPAAPVVQRFVAHVRARLAPSQRRQSPVS